MELHLKIIGYILIVLALIHVMFPKYFNWVTDLKPLSLINRQMMYVHTFFIALTVFLMGLLCVTCTNELIHSTLGKKICIGLAIFWAARLFIQFYGYSSQLWRGKKTETAVHIMFTFMWTYFTVVFSSIAKA